VSAASIVTHVGGEGFSCFDSERDVFMSEAAECGVLDHASTGWVDLADPAVLSAVERLIEAQFRVEVQAVSTALDFVGYAGGVFSFQVVYAEDFGGHVVFGPVGCHLMLH